ncbi:MAG: N-formylglutamate amidohydrolase [Kordiimonadaceae bacterium]|nr:N-formylglutamate amidohydrolase [Kordiimonadaceae bacterium]
MAFEIINPRGKANIVLICEHASNHIPDDFENLGLSEEQLKLHIAWDIGIGAVTKNVAKTLDAPAILARFSRLLIDANRAIEQDGLIPVSSDGHHISGNQNLSDDEIDARINRFYMPFHNATEKLIETKAKNNQAPLIFNLHSFTPTMNGFDRPWNAGMLWNRDNRLATEVQKRLETYGCIVGDNLPYSGQDLFHTMNTHGDRHGFPHVGIEIRQDELENEAGIEKWSRILAKEIEAIRELPELSEIKKF